MNLVQVQNQLKDLSDQQLIKEINMPSGMVPSYLALSELKRRQDLRTAHSVQEPQGTMAEQYSRGLMGSGPPNLQAAMGQSNMTGQPVIYGAGQVQGFADGGAVDDQWRSDTVDLDEVARRLGRRPKVTAPAKGFPFAAPFSGRVLPIGPETNAPNPYINVPQGIIPLEEYNLPKSLDVPYNPPGALPKPYVPPEWIENLNRGPQWLEDKIGKFSEWYARGNPGQSLSPEETQRFVKEATQEKQEGGAQTYDSTSKLPRPINPERNVPEAKGIGPYAKDVSPSDAADRDVGAGSRGRAGVGAASAGMGGTGRAAGSVGPSGLAAFMDQVRGLQQPDRYEELSRENQAEKARLENRDSDKGLALLTAGLGILGGTSPFASVNIGQGALAGVREWNDLSKEQRIAMQGVRQADQMIAIAQASRDERQLESALKLKMHYEEVLQRSADRAAAREDRAADRLESRAIREQQSVIQLMNEHRNEVKGLDAMIANPMLSEEQKRVYQTQRDEAADNLKAAAGRLRQLQSLSDKRQGRSVEPSKAMPKIIGKYNPATGRIE